MIQVVDLGYTENYYWDNIKLLLMVVACAFAMVAQFYPMPFPKSRPLLGVCCIRSVSGLFLCKHSPVEQTCSLFPPDQSCPLHTAPLVLTTVSLSALCAATSLPAPLVLTTMSLSVQLLPCQHRDPAHRLVR